MPSFIFYLAVFFEALGFVKFLSLDTQFILGCVSAVSAFTLDCLKIDAPGAKRKNELYVMTLCLFYAAHVLTMSYIAYVNQYKQWVAGADIQPLYEQPFDYPVGARLTVRLTEPMTPFSYRAPPSLYETEPNQKGRRNRYSGRRAILVPASSDSRDEKPLAGREVSLDIYFQPYLQLKNGYFCVGPDFKEEIASSLTDKERLSVFWDVYNKTSGGIVTNLEDQVKKALPSSENLEKIMRELPETSRQFLPESLNKKGFKTKENSRKQTCYIYPLMEKKDEVQQKPD